MIFGLSGRKIRVLHTQIRKLRVKLLFYRYSYDDPEFSQVLQKLDAHIRSQFNLSILNSAPFLTKFSFLSKRVSF